MTYLNRQKLFLKIVNSQKNVRYTDFVILLEAFGFLHVRSEGSHNIFRHISIKEIINIQNVNGEAKPYQIKQFLALVEKFGLGMEE